MDEKEINRLIGLRLAEIRKSRGISQRQLGEYLNISYQQILKYEKAVDRISAGKLFLCAEFLEVPVNEFFYHRAGCIDHPAIC